MRIKPGDHSPIIIVCFPHQQLAQLLGGQNQRNAGDKTVETKEIAAIETDTKNDQIETVDNLTS